MKRFLLVVLVATTTFTVLAQGAYALKETTINPELENLGGYKPDFNELNPQNSGVFGPFGNSESTEGPSYHIDANPEKQEDIQLDKSLAKVTYSLYPNPAIDYVIIQLSERITGSVEILNLVGQQVQRIEMDQSLIRLDITDLEPGIYFISISNGSEKVVKKLKVQ